MLAEAGEKLREDLGRLVNSLKLGAEVVRTWGPKVDGQYLIACKKHQIW